ncbi:Ig-like domain-containing protein [Mucilaginibacter sp.]|uniref:Ig-like domain-containing protein n=1 Tax=Mucilaginibacter sp. TaxID=1882438 RepID=UPI00261602FE|nr:Ig-like domain-containing protein [Mucilaginibacter sp.]MDB4922557.1 hypothetical protein [Mucilaginibacter sp.]
MKNLLKLGLIILFALPVYSGFCQRNFKGRVIFFDGNNKPLPNAPVRLVNEGSGTTGTDGIFTIAIKDTTNVVVLELVKSDWSIIYPVGGKAKVPKSANEEIEFYIGDSPKDILTKAVARSNNQLKDRLTQLGVKQDGIEKTLNAFRAEIQKMSDIKLADLKDEIDLDSKRTDFYPVLASAINNYTNEAKDLKDAFKFSAMHAFDDPQAFQILADAVTSYNAAFEDINKQHSDYEKKVHDLWNETKATEVRDLLNYALGELHSANIFTLNLKIRDINEYNRGNVKGSQKKAFKEIIIHEIEAAVLQLERRLQELDKRSQFVLNDLAR